MNKDKALQAAKDIVTELAAVNDLEYHNLNWLGNPKQVNELRRTRLNDLGTMLNFLTEPACKDTKG